jgi:hypothetical protein
LFGKKIGCRRKKKNLHTKKVVKSLKPNEKKLMLFLGKKKTFFFRKFVTKNLRKICPPLADPHHPPHITHKLTDVLIFQQQFLVFFHTKTTFFFFICPSLFVLCLFLLKFLE